MADTAIGTADTASAAGPAERLRELHRAGDLARSFATATDLVRRIPVSELDGVAQLFARIDADDVAEHHPDTPAVSVDVCANGTVAALPPLLAAHLARSGTAMRARSIPYTRDYSRLAWSQPPDGAGPSARLRLLLLDAHAVAEELAAPWSVADVEAALGDLLGRIRDLAARQREAPGSTLVLNTLPLPARLADQLVDIRSRTRLGIAWREFNTELLRLAEAGPATVVVDTDPILAETGPLHDDRLACYAQVRLGTGFLSAYAGEVAATVRALSGCAKKALALDLDGTLWGGVLGEDGPEGIEAAGGSRGVAFQEFQQVLAQISAQGVLLTVCSRNESGPVEQVLAEHPEMVLRREDFVAVAANRRPKPENVTEIARVLGLGRDAFVFVDDTATEIGAMRDLLPDVEVVDVGGDPATHPRRLLEGAWFRTLETTDDDRARRERYRSESRRAELRRSTGSTDDYLRHLGVQVELVRPADEAVPRLAQLTQRTNQFNLTTERLGDAEVRDRIADPAQLVAAVRSRDRFGEHGVVGAVFARVEGERLTVDNMLLSCRVFDRGIETACLRHLLVHAREHGCAEVAGRYRPSGRNGRFASFYTDHGFTAREDLAAPDSADGAPATRTFLHRLRGTDGGAPDPLPDHPDHIRLTMSLAKGTAP
ncbi:HAD-IIIC family phosphatase [Streptomonospora salina]|uniref:FkbH-like protein n=1 Tax=Streptomonospora salina TaxID=104205 RepID=A0A841EI05_9ACTN|nr:HAD-IIIC family phosphatase [Streptomonospora salina]MBB6001009.1 FkbH-like protein [Streptomonospora salina]